MTETEQTQPAPASTHWPSVFQLGLSLFGMLSLWGMALASWQADFRQYFNPSFDTSLSVSSASNALGIFLLGTLLLPSAGFAFLRLTGRSATSQRFAQKTNKFIRPGRWIFLIPIILLVGYWAIGQGNWALALLPPLLVLGAVLPVVWLLWLGKRGLPAGSPQRQWGLFASALTLGPLIMLVLEILVALVLLIFAALAFASMFAEIGPLLPADPNSLSSNPALVEQMVAEVISQPGVITLILIFLSGFVPLIEELFKPIGVWLLAGRKLTPVEGFTAGLISGAAFAIFETLTRAPEPDGWVLFVVLRIGTAIMHIFTAGLTGWALAGAFSEKRYFRLIAAYLLAVIIHGLWNATPVLFAAAFLNYTLEFDMSVPSHYIFTAPIFLLYLTLAAFSLIVYINRRFSRAQDSTLPATEELAA